MKIPKKIKVGARDYTVEIVDKINDRDDLGLTQHSTLSIKILKGKQATMEQVFLHELIHCLVGTFTELETDTLANQLHLFIKDNKGVFNE